MYRFQILSLITLGLTLSYCKSVNHDSKVSSDGLSVETDKALTLFDVNDVSILYPSPRKAAIASYISFADKTAEGVIFPKEMFEQASKIAGIDAKFTYDQFFVSGVRIDNCAKLIMQMPCVPQIRLVFQNVTPDGKGDIEFDDQTIHVPFDVEVSKANGMYKDFMDLKLSALPESTKGKLGVHPILAKEGANGKFGAKLKAIVSKYALTSKLERVAVMATEVKGNNATWTFAASKPIKDGKIEATPIPCQSGETTNIFSSSTIFPPFPSMPTTFSGRVNPDVKNCKNLDATLLITQERSGSIDLDDDAKKKVIDDALAINDPSKVFFASTTCVNCHLASRRLDFALGQKFLTEKDGNPFRYQAPEDVTSTYTEVKSAGGGNTWNLRAFGWNETATGVAVSLYTFNDTMRVAHELNDMIRAGSLK